MADDTSTTLATRIEVQAAAAQIFVQRGLHDMAAMTLEQVAEEAWQQAGPRHAAFGWGPDEDDLPERHDPWAVIGALALIVLTPGLIGAAIGVAGAWLAWGPRP